MISLLARQLLGRALASTCMVLRPIAFKKQLNRPFYPILMLEKEVEWWSLLSALTIYCYCLQRLIVSLKFASTKRDNYLLTLNCTEAHVQCNLRQIT